MAESDQKLPEPTEQIHLPGPTYLPVLVALGVTVALCGVLVAWWMVAAGLIVTVVAIFRWVRETRSDIAELPLEH